MSSNQTRFSDLKRVPNGLICPFCGRSYETSESANGKNSAFWFHFFSKKHAEQRGEMSEAEIEEIRSAIVRSHRRNRKDEKERQDAEKAERSRFLQSENRRRNKSWPVKGAMLDDIVSEMRDLISMMEPYYSQADGAADAEAMIARIEALSRPEETASKESAA